MGTFSRRTRLDTQSFSSKTLKRRSDATSGRDNGTVHRCESHDRSDDQSQRPTSRTTLLQHDVDPATNERPIDHELGATYSEAASNRNSEATSRVSDTVFQAPRASAETHALVGRAEEAYASSSQINKAWNAQSVFSPGDNVPVNISTRPDHVISPSVSSSYNLEDGIFEPGSAYQNLFQSLRSHVFRTAQIENDAPEKIHTPAPRWNAIAAGHRDTLGDRQSGLAGAVVGSGNAAVVQEFELSPAQEYLLWKAWTEEVSIWVRGVFISLRVSRLTRT